MTGETFLYLAMPVAGYGRMGLLANGALSGGIISGLQLILVAYQKLIN